MITLLFPILMVVLVVVMMRSQKKRQQQQANMQSAMEPGSAVRTIGGLYATVKAINENSVELEIAPGVVTHFSKQAVAAVVDPQEYDEIVNGRPEQDEAEVEAAEADAAVDEAVADEVADLDKPAAK
ncbi:preprotein translocase subunit YajC [Kitasatospora sp. NPDC058965]|uniref:preprotein translocase subunit YajC n=1 Tax=Kitasatospora sp. NPDC058965 TaxID=3346682 RepID=UPI00369DF86D